MRLDSIRFYTVLEPVGLICIYSDEYSQQSQIELKLLTRALNLSSIEMQCTERHSRGEICSHWQASVEEAKTVLRYSKGTGKKRVRPWMITASDTYNPVFEDFDAE